jgi:VanZ family protein
VAPRRWFVVAFALAVAFALYGSWVPFRFHGPFALARVFPVLRDSLAGGPGGFSRPDFLANILFFIPIGFFGGAVAAPPRRSLVVRVAAAVPVLCFALAVSLLCESVQVFLPERVASLWDVAAETSGAACGLLGWFIVGGELHRWLGTWLSGETGAVWRPWLVLYALGRFFILLYPFDVTINPLDLAHKLRSGGVVLNPWHSPALHLAVLPDLIRDAIVAVPVGVLACVIGVRPGARRGLLASMVVGAVVFGVIEAAQVFIISCRADVLEWAVNSLGAAVGVLLVAWLSSAPVDSRARDRSHGRLALAGLAASMLLYGVYNWSPFDFHVSMQMVHDRSGLLVSMPFYSYWVNPEFKALGEALVKLSIGAPMGVFLYWFLVSSSSSYRRLIAALSILSVVGFVTVIEIGQVFLPSRYADLTDIMLALIGACAGAVAARLTGLVEPASRTT